MYLKNKKIQIFEIFKILKNFNQIHAAHYINCAWSTGTCKSFILHYLYSIKDEPERLAWFNLLNKIVYFLIKAVSIKTMKFSSEIKNAVSATTKKTTSSRSSSDVSWIAYT